MGKFQCGRGEGLKKKGVFPDKTGMIPLTADEIRVLGVMIEKEMTVPDTYPLSLNALVNGCNQKNNRDPLVDFTEDRVFDAVEQLRAKGLVVRVDQAGSRVSKFKHQTMEKLGLTKYELVILAELMLRGPQTPGEIRTRASRMHHLDTLEVVNEMLSKMNSRPEPLVKEYPSSRAPRWGQLLCPDAHPIEPSATAVASDQPSTRSLTDRIAELEGRVVTLEGAILKLAEALGDAEIAGMMKKG